MTPRRPTRGRARLIRAAGTVAGVGLGGILAIYPVALAPGRAMVAIAGAAAGAMIVTAAAAPQRGLATVAAGLLIGEYGLAVGAAPGEIDLAAPVYGLLVVLLLEAFDLAGDGRAGVAVAPRLVARRVAFVATAAGAGAVAGVGVVALRPVTEVGGLLTLAASAVCVGLALAVPARLVGRLFGPGGAPGPGRGVRDGRAG